MVRYKRRAPLHHILGVLHTWVHVPFGVPSEIVPTVFHY